MLPETDLRGNSVLTPPASPSLTPEAPADQALTLGPVTAPLPVAASDLSHTSDPAPHAEALAADVPAVETRSDCPRQSPDETEHGPRSLEVQASPDSALREPIAQATRTIDSEVALQAQRELAALRSQLHAASSGGFAPSQLDFGRMSRGSSCYRRFFRTYGDFVRSSGLRTARERVLQTSVDRRAAAHAAALGLAQSTNGSSPTSVNVPIGEPRELPKSALPLKVEPARQLAPEAPSTYQPRSNEPVYGVRISGCDMTHAPVNEQGVVLLFGMLAGRLGYEVEMVRTGFPDCEAKRKSRDGKLRKVRIEFEFLTSRFDHDPKGCDLVVCWEDDAKMQGMEVLELKKHVGMGASG
ncbi:MAG: hypothetical protein KF805_16235 [Phycisphaeraceae bacterium]|nr:hypothetical protein [Phycisphaeraceae bacterium]